MTQDATTLWIHDGDDRRAFLGRVAKAAHFVQLYEDEAFLADTVAHFVGSGLAGREPAVVIATEPHRTAFRRALEAASFDVDRACRAGQLTWLDASTCLDAFMIGDTPDAELFDQHVGSVVERLSSRRRAPATVRAYGEMVDILWQRGNRAAALRLEALWNALAERHELALLCTYGVRSFTDAADEEAFGRVCSAHTHVFPTEHYSELRTEDERLRRIAFLEQRANALESEIERRVALEQTLREALASVERSEGDLRDFLENGLEGIHWVGADGTILFANRAELELLGYSREEYVGHHIAEFHADGDVIDDILHRLCNGETLRDREARLRCKDGSIKHVLIHSNVYWRDGKFVHTRCFTRDITERKRAEEALREQSRELETANRMKDEFLATVSHELRTPLNAILGWVGMLRAGTLPEDKRERALQTIERNAQSQAQLIEDLLDVSRIISGKLRLDIANVDLSLLVDHAIDAVRPAALAKQIALHQEVDADLGPVLGDADRLQQVMWNLVANAVKFTPTGGSVRVAVRKRSPDVEIVVTDTGEGIAPDFLPNVFERFRQADASSSRKHGGLGLGLAIVRSLVELHGGFVRVESEGLGKGATFTVTLPVSPMRSPVVERPPAVRLATSSRTLQPPAELEGVRVLVVDDEPDARELIAEILTTCNAVVDVAGSVEEGFARLKARRPDIVVSDIGMPDQDGYAFIRRLRALPEAEGGRTPAVALTAFARFEDRTKALAAGFDMHAAKPVDAVELLTVLAGLATVFRQ